MRTLFVIAVLLVIPLTAYVVWDRAMDRFFLGLLVGETGPVEDPKDWPRPLLDAIEELEHAGLNPNTIQVHCLCHAFDDEYVWRMDGDTVLFQLLEKKWRLIRVETPDWHILRNGRSHNSGIAPPAWWSPQQDGQTSFYVCPQELAKEKGDRFHVAFDPAREIVFVHYWFNF